MNCEYCTLEMHFLCLLPTDDNCCCEDGTPPIFATEPDFGIPTAAKPVKEPGKVGRPQKAVDDIAFPLTTGRKRAVEVKIQQGWSKGSPCEWAYLKYAGGGVKPIIGCKGNPSRDVHHGPDKNTLNNSDDNLHAICSICHHHWHTVNDEFYAGDRPESDTAWVPAIDYASHDAETSASEEEIDADEFDWMIRRRNSRIAKKDRKP